MKDLESHDDLVLHLDIKNSAFETDETISQTFNQFISNVLINMNGQPLTRQKEVTAILDIKENGIFKFEYIIICIVRIFFRIALLFYQKNLHSFDLKT